MRAYLEVLRDTRARGPLLTSGIARLTPGMMGVALVLATRQGGYGYAIAGIVAGAHQLGVGVGSPIQGRLADRLGHPRVLVPDAIAYLAGAILLVWGITVGWPVASLVAIAFVTGAVQAPTTICSRALLGTLFSTGRLRETVFATSSIAVELGFILGPVSVVVISALAGAKWAVLLAATFGAIGAIGYARTEAVRDHRPIPRPAAGNGALRSTGLRVMVVSYGFLAMSFGTFDLVAAAVAERTGVASAAGTLVSTIAFGSLMGGVVYGSRIWPGTLLQRLRVRIVAFAATLAAVPFVLDSLVVLSVVLLITGLTIGPMNICSFQIIDDLAPAGARAEAQSWSQASVFVGSAVGAAIGGAMIDLSGPSGAMLFGAGTVVVAAFIVNLGRTQIARVRDDAASVVTAA